MKALWLICYGLTLISFAASAQSFEVTGIQENYKGLIGETIKAPLLFKNTSDKTVTLIIRKVSSELGSTQKNYFCIDGNCLDQKVEDHIVKVEPGQTLTSFNVSLEAGLVATTSSVKYIAYNKSNPTESQEIDLQFVVEEKPERQTIYTSRHISIHDVYPNPVNDHAFVDYRVLNDKIKAKIIIHNILGSPVGEYELPVLESKVKIRGDDLTAGIYFYTVYIDNEGVMTRKLIVKH
jgi:hypothetical protein